MMTSRRGREPGKSRSGWSWGCIYTVAEEIMAETTFASAVIVQMSDGGTEPLSVHFNELGSYPRYELDVF